MLPRWQLARQRVRGHVGVDARRYPTNGDEFMEMNVDVDPDWGVPPGGEPTAVSSDRGAANLGFAGTVSTETGAVAGGMTTLAEDEFGSGPRLPMIPGTWNPDQAGSP
ncbi:hypothetical protein SRL2020226_60490 [Mycobacterium kiyosense]|jgi:PPE-repeat protein|uniref:PPE-PPW subfamily C-terminal domain-containing protein n=1 Tax=Mycobacterium kiyosense TaxID=2871094 RepID=A0AA37PYN2_9MYCO|nr:hypothetical protein SRL2020028_59810 [Mycobacterium kiyosense]GLB99273.1 hypothetical protein SRL2020226_60490 [Mycobacterium kiyosense]